MMSGISGVLLQKLAFFGLLSAPVAQFPLVCSLSLVAAIFRSGGGSSKLLRVSQGGEVDVYSSLAPVLLLRRRVKSVSDVLKGIWTHGFSQGRWDALLGRWKAVCDQGPCWPLRSLDPWVHGVPPDLHGFHKWVFDALGVLDEFLRLVLLLGGTRDCVAGQIG